MDSPLHLAYDIGKKCQMEKFPEIINSFWSLRRYSTRTILTCFDYGRFSSHLFILHNPKVWQILAGDSVTKRPAVLGIKTYMCQTDDLKLGPKEWNEAET